METPDLLGLLVAPVHRAGLAYMIAGSVAGARYGEPRFTADVVLVLSIPTPEAKRLPLLFPSPDYFCPPEDILLAEIGRQDRAHFNIVHIPSGLKADFYPCRNQPLFQWGIQHRRLEETPSGEFYFAPPEYVILWKLLYHREGGSEKHLRDIAAILKVQEGRLDHAILLPELERLSLLPAFQALAG